MRECQKDLGGLPPPDFLTLPQAIPTSIPIPLKNEEVDYLWSSLLGKQITTLLLKSNRPFFSEEAQHGAKN